VLAIFIICIVYTILVGMFFLVARYFWRQRLSSRRYYEDEKEDCHEKPPAYDDAWRNESDNRGGRRDNSYRPGLVRLVNKSWRTVRGFRTWGSAETAAREHIRRGKNRGPRRRQAVKDGEKALRKVRDMALDEANRRAGRRRK
jgi:hypothetical protein